MHSYVVIVDDSKFCMNKDTYHNQLRDVFPQPHKSLTHSLLITSIDINCIASPVLILSMMGLSQFFANHMHIFLANN